MLRQPVIVFSISILFFFVSLENVYAYLDPGSGSYVFQIIIGLLLGGIFSIKLFWRNIIAIFKKLFFKKNIDEGTKR